MVGWGNPFRENAKEKWFYQKNVSSAFFPSKKKKWSLKSMCHSKKTNKRKGHFNGLPADYDMSDSPPPNHPVEFAIVSYIREFPSHYGF